jgi:2-C-methyl-D-erythritol 4-phosphate cytidylyltransferase
VIVAGGNGTRFGQRKQFAQLRGRPVVAWSIDVARRVCAGVVVVLPDGLDDADAAVAAELDQADKVVIGGVLRSQSVRAGLAAVPTDAAMIAVHDAARPLAGIALWTAVLDALEAGADGAIPVVSVADTITMVGPGGKRTPVDRAALRAVQTPQAFLAPVLRRAHDAGDNATDDAALVEAVGGKVVLVDGEAVNLKITMPSDLVVAGALLGEVSRR